MATMSLKGEEPELFSGVLFKCGGKVKSWNKRFFVLKSDFLYYYKDTNKGALGAISLKDPKFEARRGDVSDVSWPRQTKSDCRLAIVTSHRTYCAYSMYSHEIEDWIRLLTNAREKIVSEGITQNKLLSGGRSVSSSEVEQTQQSKPSDSEKSRPLSLGEDVQPGNYEAAYDAPGSTKQTEEAVYEPQEPETVEAIYALASPVEPEQEMLYEELSPKEDPAVSQEATPSKDEMYEEMSPQPEAAVVTTEQEPPTSQPLYDDIKTEVAQPLYEDIPPQYPSASYAPQDEEPPSDNHPPKADTPPPRPGVSPPLPPKDNSETQNSTSETNDFPHMDGISPSNDSPPMYDMPETDEATPSNDSPPTYETPPTFDAPATNDNLPTDNTSEMAPTHDMPPVLLEAESTQQVTPVQQKPVPRRRSFSPNQQANEPPVAKPRTPHGHADEATGDTEQGMLLFNLQKQKIEESRLEKKRAQNLMAEVTADPKLSQSKKLIFAETMREVEQEKLLANEERLRWERERKKLEEERKQFEEEKKRLKEELQQNQLQLQAT